jgi:membrane protein
MYKRFKILKMLVMSTFETFLEHEMLTYGAALSFFMIFALPPFLILLLWGTSFFLDSTIIQTRILTEALRLGGTQARDVIDTILSNMTAPDPSNFFTMSMSASLLFFTASGAVLQLQHTLNKAWGVQLKKRSRIKNLGVLMRKRLRSVVLLFTCSVSLVTLLIADGLIAILRSTVGARWGILQDLHFFRNLSLTLAGVLLVLLVACVFKFLPDVKLTWADVLPGAFLTSAILASSRYLVGLYLAHYSMGSAYGAAGSTVVFVLWLFLNVLIFLWGAMFSVVYFKHKAKPLQLNRYVEPVSPAIIVKKC